MDKEAATTERKRDGGGSRWEGTDGVKELGQVTRSVGRVSGLAVAWLSGSAKGGGSIQAVNKKGRCFYWCYCSWYNKLLYEGTNGARPKRNGGYCPGQAVLSRWVVDSLWATVVCSNWGRLDWISAGG